MKITHIKIKTYSTLQEVYDAFWSIPKEMKHFGVQMTQNKRLAERNIKYQYEHFKWNGARVFWWKKVKNDNKSTVYIMYETVINNK